MEILPKPDDPVDTGQAQKRLKMQLYSRMMTDLMVLTGGKRLPTDDEIHTELRRAARAYGVWSLPPEAAWRTSMEGARTGPRLAAHDPVDVDAPWMDVPGLAENGEGEEGNDGEHGGIPLNIDRWALADEILGTPFPLASNPDDQALAGDNDGWLVQDIDTAIKDSEKTATRPQDRIPPPRAPVEPRSNDRWRAHVTDGVNFKPDIDKSYFAFLLGEEGIAAADRLRELHRHILNGTSLTDHLLQELHPSDERLAKTLDVIKIGVANSEALRAAFGTDIERLQRIVDTEQVRAGAAYVREAKAFGTAYAIEAASNAAGFGVGKVVGKVTPTLIEAAAPSVRAFGRRVDGAFSQFAGGAAESGPAKYVRQGLTPAQAEYLSLPYKGMGHHFIPRRTGLPKALSDSSLNVLKPKGMTRGDFYELHYKVDLSFHGARFPRRIGGSWSGRALGLEKYGDTGRLWHGSPTSLKATVGGTSAAGVATGIYVLEDD